MSGDEADPLFSDCHEVVANALVDRYASGNAALAKEIAEALDRAYDRAWDTCSIVGGETGL